MIIIALFEILFFYIITKLLKKKNKAKKDYLKAIGISLLLIIVPALSSLIYIESVAGIALEQALGLLSLSGWVFLIYSIYKLITFKNSQKMTE